MALIFLLYNNWFHFISFITIYISSDLDIYVYTNIVRRKGLQMGS